jgi:hypothetical protein
MTFGLLPALSTQARRRRCILRSPHGSGPTPVSAPGSDPLLHVLSRLPLRKVATLSNLRTPLLLLSHEGGDTYSPECVEVLFCEVRAGLLRRASCPLLGKPAPKRLTNSKEERSWLRIHHQPTTTAHKKRHLPVKTSTYSWMSQSSRLTGSS